MKPFAPLAILVALSMLNGCALAQRSAEPDGEREPEPAELYRLDREGFVQELVFPFATPRTIRFDDYTRGSYHVDKLDLLAGVRERRRAGTPIAAVVIRGPGGLLWAYQIDLFLLEGDGIRVNTVGMPHARIAFKSTKLITRPRFEELLGVFASSEALVRGLPASPAGRTEADGSADGLEWSYDTLIATWIDDDEETFHTTAAHSLSEDPPQSVIRLDEAIEAVTDGGTVTYAADLAGEESIYREIEIP